MHEDISMITKMVEAGASGYILKRTNMNEVLEAIRVVADNGKYLQTVVSCISYHPVSLDDRNFNPADMCDTLQALDIITLDTLPGFPQNHVICIGD